MFDSLQSLYHKKIMNNNNWLWIWCFLFSLFIRCKSFFDAPQIEEFTFPSHVVADKNISAFCSAKDAEFFWFKDDKVLTNSSNIIIKSQEDYTIIIIRSVSAQSEGNYTCIATNKFGMSSRSEILTVITHPKWLIEQLDLVAVIGERVSLECLSEELSKETTKSIRKNKNETITEIMSLDLPNESIMLKAMKVEGDEAYEYTVDYMTSLSTKKDLVKPKIPARFDDNFLKVAVIKGDSASLPCEAIGDQLLTIIWKRDGKELKNISGERFDIYETLTTNGLKSELFLREVDRTDGQLYTCIAENSYGKDEKNINLFVMEVPSIPLDLKIQKVTKRDVNVSWSTPYPGNSPITKYVIQFWKYTASGGRHYLEENAVSSVQTSDLIENLHPGVNYELAVIAENALGRGEPSEIVSFTTGEDKPTGAPLDVNVGTKGSDSLIVTWKPPSDSERNGQLKGYYVGYKINLDPNPYSFKKISHVVEEFQKYIVTNLQKDTEYRIVVKAFNSIGSGPPSQDIIVKTLIGDLPLAPTVSVVSTTENSIKLHWRSTDNEIEITGYVIHYQKKEERWERVSITSVNETSHSLTGLQNGTFYHIYVTANNDYGEGNPSNLVTTKTNDGDNATALLAGVIKQKSITNITHVIPVTASVLTAIIVSVALCIWVVKAKSRKDLERSIQEDKHFILAEAETQMHDRTDKSRSLIAYPASIHFSTPCAINQMRDDISVNDLKDGGNKEMRSFLSQKIEDTQLSNSVTLKKQQHHRERTNMHGSLKTEKNLGQDF